MTVEVVVKDHGAKRARELLKKDRKELWIGVLAAQGAAQHPSGDTIGQIAFWMEYGFTAPDGREIAPRSWLRDWLDENEKIIKQQLGADTARVLFSKPPESEKKALEKRGGVYRRQIQVRIRNVPANWQGLAESTIRKKGHSAPLIDTTTFINAIRYEVR
jgi:hypothetical protein